MSLWAKYTVYMTIYSRSLLCCLWQCWAIPQIGPQIGPQIRKLRTQGFGLRIANRFLTANICRFAVKKLKFTANQQHRWDRFFAISKKIRFYD